MKKSLILCIAFLVMAACNHVTPIEELENLLKTDKPRISHFLAVAHSHRFSSFTVMLRSRKPTFVRWRLISSGV